MNFLDFHSLFITIIIISGNILTTVIKEANCYYFEVLPKYHLLKKVCYWHHTVYAQYYAQNRIWRYFMMLICRPFPDFYWTHSSWQPRKVYPKRRCKIDPSFFCFYTAYILSHIRYENNFDKKISEIKNAMYKATCVIFKFFILKNRQNPP